MRVVITGATGNVGTSLVEALADEPAVDTIVGIARRPPAVRAPKTMWVSADVGKDDMGPHLQGADALVHLAWLFHPMRRPTVTWQANAVGSARVFRAAAEAGVATIVYASSVGAYSPGPKDRPVDETWPTHGWPTAGYAREKAYVERTLDGLAAERSDIRVVRLRPAFIFKRESASEQRRLFAGPLLPSWLVRREFIPIVPDFPGLRFQALHTADAAEAFRLALVRPVAGAFNLAAEPVVDARVLAELLGARPLRVPRAAVRTAMAAAYRLRAMPVDPRLLDVFVRVPILDSARARDELGWQPRHTATEALAELFAGMREEAGMPTPPLDPRTSGRLRGHELATGVGEHA
ncbi:MAG TPA: NAD-dependent epimerase/dehydratase family protein [Egibacteraceae bacterium]|nr:NAD-dependent epimerase/dehydratase family protein [Egibacteraceae bacterium]